VSEQHHSHDHPPVGGGAECLACPVCVLLQAVSSVRPEVVQHLAAAGRELTLALAALVEAQVAAHEPSDRKVQRIRVDD
jgi:hypothetical protein